MTYDGVGITMTVLQRMKPGMGSQGCIFRITEIVTIELELFHSIQKKKKCIPFYLEHGPEM